MQKRKRIYIAYTGGTIGMRPTSDGFAPVAGYLTNTLSKMPEFHRKEMPEFVLHEYSTLLDSSDIHPSHWQAIAEDIELNYSEYDGFIILHGTDTMAYTASALSFMLEDLEKPVIVTGSQIPLSELRSDGQTNLLNALYLAAHYPISEVTLFFNNKLFRGNRVRKVDANGFDAFDSPNFSPLIEAGIHIKISFPKLIHDAEGKTEKPLVINRVVAQPIGLVYLYPGISTSVIENVIKEPVTALILLSYGVGNAPQNERLLQQLSFAIDNQIIVVNCTQCYRGKVNMLGYANGQTLKNLGVLSGGDMTPEAILSKLHVILSDETLCLEERKHLIISDLKGELSTI